MEEIRCSFCGKTENEGERYLIEGIDGFICNQCIDVCKEMIDEDKKEKDKLKEFSHELEKLPKPKEIKSHLDEYVIGQDEAKKVLSVSVYNHYKRILAKKDTINDVELQKSNVLLIGPTGSGKTLLAQTLAKVLHVPFAIADATTVTEAGYVGDDVENVLLRLYQAADCNVKATERGIIYIDEIDKIGRKSENTSITRDVSGEGVQQALLKIIEGTTSSIAPQGGRKHPMQKMIDINTENILFIVGGAFDGIEKIIEKRINKKIMGFGSDIKKNIQNSLSETLKYIIPDDLIKFGMIPEFTGRVPVITGLNELDEESFIRILVEPKNSLVKQYKKYFSFDNIKIEFEDKALEKIAHLAKKRNIGARGLRSILEKIMLDLMYEVPSKEGISEIIITKESIEDKEKVIIK